VCVCVTKEDKTWWDS